MKEGIVIYEGITSDLDLNNIGKWKYKLTLYFTTDILFDLFGLNGEFFRQQAEEFFNLTKEINRNDVFIKFRYFQKTKTEIQSYFFNAKRYVADNEIPKIDTAMKEILSRASSVDEILELKNKFFAYLMSYKILEDEFDVREQSSDENDAENQEEEIMNADGQSFYHAEKNRKYNLMSGYEQDDSENNDRKRIYMYEPLINNINILREGKNEKKLNEAKFLLVTRNHKILEIAKEKKFCSEGEFSKAVFLDFLTTRFWFWLNKGFGQKTSYKSLDMFYKSKAVLSSFINANVARKFDELIERKKKNPNGIDDKIVKETILDLRNELKTPEEIEKETLEAFDSILAFGNLNQEFEEIEARNQKILETEKENFALKSENEILKRREKFRNKLLIYILIGIAFFFFCKKISPLILKFFLDEKKIGVVADYITFFGFVPMAIHLIKEGVSKAKQCFLRKNEEPCATSTPS